jgi:hypothetical protein
MARANTVPQHDLHRRTAFGYLVTYRLQEWLDPAVLRLWIDAVHDTVFKVTITGNTFHVNSITSGNTIGWNSNGFQN